jgi:DeoR family glycerol-3-phosphate regulon repressor
MVAAYRREAILELARQGSELRVDDIARQFSVSRETVRRDLGHLQSQGLLRRVHGGAIAAQTGWEAAFRQRMVSNASAKQRIAELAATLFRKNDTLMIDTGTTTLILAAELAAVDKLTVITNSFGVAKLLAAGPAQHRVYVVGGEFRVEAEQTLGSACLEQISRYRADHAVLSCGALDPDGAIMDFDLEEAMFARAMIAQAESATLIIDNSKLDRVAMAKVCDLELIDRVVTDTPPPSHYVDLFHANDVELLVAGEGVLAAEAAPLGAEAEAEGAGSGSSP